LRVLTPGNAGHAAWVYTSSFGGGLVDGDHLALDIEVRTGAAAFISTQASTKVYRSTRGASAELHARIAPDACLVLAPDPVVCFAASRYRQMQQFELAAGASLVLVDWLSSGRHVSGERWAFEEYHSRIRVRQDGRLIVHDAVALRASDGNLVARLGRWNILGVVMLLGAAVRDAAAAIVAQVARDPVVRRADQIATATAVGDGCVLRFMGTSVEHVARTVRAHLTFVHRLLGDDPWARKW
jgi:urease accessory protein